VNISRFLKIEEIVKRKSREKGTPLSFKYSGCQLQYFKQKEINEWIKQKARSKLNAST
jgi:hypothetical protein